MRARLSWLALIPLFILTGCRTASDQPAGDDVALTPLSVMESNLAEALAHYTQSLICDSTLGGFEESLRQTRLAAELDPSNVLLTLKAAAGFIARKEYAEAIATLERSLAVNPDSVDLRMLLGIACQVSGETRKAKRTYGDVIRLQPDFPDAYVRLAAIQLGENHESKALATLEAGLAAAENCTALIDFLENLGRIHIVGGKVKEAIRCFDLVAKRQPDDLAVQELLGRCHAEIGNTDKAISLLTGVLKQQTNNADVALAIGDIYEDAKDLARAEEYYTMAARSEKTDAASYVRLGNLLIQTNLDRAARSIEEGLRKFPGDFSLHALMGLIYIQQRRFKDAVDQYSFIESEVTRNPAQGQKLQPAFYFWYGSACEQAGQFERAEELLGTCLRLDPDMHQALNYLAYMWADKGTNLDKALDYVSRALKMDPEDAAYLDTLGWIYFKQRRYPEALKKLKKAFDLMPDDPTVTEHVGDAWHALGNDRKAADFWRLSLKLKPENKTVREKLGLPPSAPQPPPGP